MYATVEFDQTSVRLLVRALRDEADGKELRRDLVRNLRAAAQPAAAAARASILSMPSQGLGQTPSLRASIATGIRVHVILSGKAKNVGVAIKAHSKGMPRQFRRAPKYLNRKRPWRHPVFGNRDVWVDQVSRKPGWFHDSIAVHRPAFIEAAGEALDNVARRISAKTRG